MRLCYHEVTGFRDSFCEVSIGNPGLGVVSFDIGSGEILGLSGPIVQVKLFLCQLVFM